MISRTARKLEATLLCTRQALPRPARLYSTPSQKRSSPATATASSYVEPSLPPFISQNVDTSDNIRPKLRNFLARDPSYILIPTPEPVRATTLEGERWYGDTRTLDMTGIIDACLYNLYDVPRAMEVFKRLRTRIGSANIETPMYNSFLIAYLGMGEREPHKKSEWLKETWDLYHILERESEQVYPNAKTYSIMLHILHQNKNEALQIQGSRDEAYLLTKIVQRNIPIMDVVGNPYFGDPQMITEIAQKLAVQAIRLKFPEIVEQLGQGEITPEESNAFEDVPRIEPVTKAISVNGETESEIPFNISGLRRQLNKFTEARSFLKQDAYARQKHLETSVYDLAKERLDHVEATLKEIGATDGNFKNLQLRKWMAEWHSKLSKALKVEIDRIEKEEEVLITEKEKSDQIGPYLKLVKPDRLSLLTILEIMRLQNSGGIMGGMKTTRALLAVGKAVENEHKAQICKHNQIPVPEFGPRQDMFTVRGYQNLHKRRAVAAKAMSDAEDWTASWGQSTRVKVGSILVDLLIQHAEIVQRMVDPKTNKVIKESHPAFYQSYEYVRGQKLGIIKVHEEVINRIAKDSLEKTIHPRHLPMLVKPRPWTSYNQGGYIYSKSYAMRFKDSYEQQVHLREATAAGNCELVFAGLDVLGSTPWRVNREIFDVVIKAWNAGERMGKLPPATYEQPEPTITEEELKDMSKRSYHMQRMKAWTQGKANNHSERCNVNYKIEIARAFLHDTLYLPHNLDFRGRAYPIPPHLNHMGDDVSRALLVFDEAKPLGERGFRWLKIHAANLWGYDKASFSDRVVWTEERMEQIFESATNPLEGSRWWLKADDPWQFLATCNELKKAYSLEDPTQYSSRLPVHQDGTCNGLQHYAALGGDTEGAEQVNLAATDKPSDVYTYISLKVQDKVKEDADAGNETAKLLVGNISRKVVKQTVMTTVYGVTFVGAREQIEKQLRDRTNIPEEKTWAAASYLAKKLLATIGDTFKGAKDIQNWLNICARLISKSIPEERLALARDEAGKRITTLKKLGIKKQQMTSVVWTTALGLPIVQPYRKTARKQVMTAIQSVYISDPRVPSEVNSTKQASAFPPNFIHSLDATHMLLTALECRNQNLTFASIHDSYWTHASDVDNMSAIIRDTFIALHSSDILERLDKEFRTRYAHYQVPLVDIRGSRATGSKLVQNLKEAGTRIYAHPSQADDLAGIQDIVEYTASSDDAVVLSTSSLPISELESKTRAREDEDEVDEDVVDGDEFDVDLAPKKEETRLEIAARKRTEKKERTARQAAAEAAGLDFKLLDNKFIKLTDLFPPLPKKGDFQVETIKKSDYFFS